MMNQCIILIFLWCCAVGCQLTKGQSVSSSWEKLQEAKSLACKDWPITNEELEITELYPIDLLTSSSFIVNGRERNGSAFNYAVPIQGKNINSRKRVALEWGFGTEFLGSLAVDGEALVLLEARLPSGKKRLEVRDLARNVIRYKSAERDAEFRSQQIVPDNTGFWLAYKTEKSEESLEDQPFQFVRFEWTDKAELKTVSSPRFSPIGDIALVSLTNEQVLGVLLDTGTSEQQKPANFQYFILEKGQQPKMRPLNVEISERVESWSLAGNVAGVVLAYVTGDTLLWENASLQIVRLDDRATIMQKQGFQINHEHVGDPLLVTAGAGIYLFVSKWLDRESSVAVYRVTTSDIQELGMYGVFPEGTYLQNAFFASTSQAVFLITQAPAGLTRQYSYCVYNL